MNSFKKTALSDDDLIAFCKKNSLNNFEVSDLDKLNEASNRYIAIFTGNTPDYLNNGHDHHWILANANQVFDSYGSFTKIKLPKPFVSVPNSPNRLQEFGSDVCGHYCLAYLYFLQKRAGNQIKNLQERAQAFSEYFGLSEDKHHNDQQVYKFYQAHKM